MLLVIWSRFDNAGVVIYFWVPTQKKIQKYQKKYSKENKKYV